MIISTMVTKTFFIYMKSLEIASVTQDISAFAKFMAHLVRENMEGHLVAHLPGS